MNKWQKEQFRVSSPNRPEWAIDAATFVYTYAKMDQGVYTSLVGPGNLPMMMR